MRTAAELGYGGPDPAARALRQGRAGAIGVILGRLLAESFDDVATAQFLKGVSDATDPQQLALSSRPACPPRPRPTALRCATPPSTARSCTPFPQTTPLIDAARQRNLHTVIVDSPAIGGEPQHELDFVGIDDAAGAEAAVRQLLDLGRRQLTILSFGLNDDSRPGPIDITEHAHATANVTKARLEGCVRAIAAAGKDSASVPAEQVPL